MSDDNLADVLNGMAASLVTAAELFGKDADLDRNDALGDIDLGAARQAFELAKSYAADIVARDCIDRVMRTGPGLALRQIALVLTSTDVTIYEAFVPTLGRLVDEALAIPQGDAHGPAVAKFEQSIDAALQRLLCAPSGRW